MKIFLISASLGDGGSQRVLVNYANFFAEKKNLKVYFISLGLKDDYEEELNEKIKVIKFKKKKASAAFFKLIKLFISEKPDKVISSQSHINILTILVTKLVFLDKRKIFLREANTILYSDSNLLKKNIKIFLIKFLYTGYNVICSSNGLSQEIYKINRNLKIYTIYIPIDKKNIIKKSKIKCSQLLLLKDTKFILFFGRLKKHKGVMDLIKAFNKAKLKNINLVILGDGPIKKELINYVNINKLDDRIHFINFQKNPFPIINAAMFCVLPSYFEGIPNVILQSITLGKNILCYNCNYGPVEIFGEQSKLLVNVGDINELSLKIKLLSFESKKYFSPEILNKFSTSKNLGRLYKIMNL